MKQKDLISSIKGLKEIKPRQEWVVLAKAEIFRTAESAAKVNVDKPSLREVFKSLFLQRKLAYSFVALLFVVVGLIGLNQLNTTNNNQNNKPVVVLSSQDIFKQNVASLSTGVNNLAQVTKEGNTEAIPSTIKKIKTNATALVQNLKSEPTVDTKDIKEIAVILKTLAFVSSPDDTVSSSTEISDLYKTVVESQIADLNKATLTEEQRVILTQAEQLYKETKYTEALEKILTINITENTTKEVDVSSTSTEITQ